MPKSFSELKKNRKNFYEQARQQVQNVANPKNSYQDERFWSLTVDNSGNGQATIRFLPSAPGEDTPFVQVFNHAFQGPGGWYIEECLSTINQTDPVNELNSYLWNEVGDKERVRKQKRKLSYIANILVVDDPGNPENNGKVFLYKFGKKIFDMINAKMFPEDEDDKPVNVFDPWEGANFKLKAKTKDGFRNYDMSKFLKSKPISEDDEEIEQVWNQQYPLNEFVDPNNSERFKAYTTLKNRLIKVCGADAAEFFGQNAGQSNVASKAAPAAAADDDDDDEDEVSFEDNEEQATSPIETDDDEDDEQDDGEDDDLPFDLDDDDDDDLESFQDLVDKD